MCYVLHSAMFAVNVVIISLFAAGFTSVNGGIELSVVSFAIMTR